MARAHETQGIIFNLSPNILTVSAYDMIRFLSKPRDKEAMQVTGNNVYGTRTMIRIISLYVHLSTTKIAAAPNTMVWMAW